MAGGLFKACLFLSHLYPQNEQRIDISLLYIRRVIGYENTQSVSLIHSFSKSPKNLNIKPIRSGDLAFKAAISRYGPPCSMLLPMDFTFSLNAEI